MGMQTDVKAATVTSVTRPASVIASAGLILWVSGVQQARKPDGKGELRLPFFLRLFFVGVILTTFRGSRCI